MDALDEELVSVVCEYLSACEMAGGMASCKGLRDGCVAGARRLNKQTPKEGDDPVRRLHLAESHTFTFDAGFSPAPRRGDWFLQWRGALQRSAQRRRFSSDDNWTADLEGFGRKASLLPAHDCGSKVVKGCAALTAAHVEELFSAAVEPLVLCTKESEAARSTRASGPSQRWLSLFHFGEFIDEQITIIRDLNSQHLPNPDDHVFALVAEDPAAYPVKGYKLGMPFDAERDLCVKIESSEVPIDSVLIFAHHQFHKVRQIIGPERSRKLDIPNDMSIDFGGDGTTAALVLLAVRSSRSHSGFRAPRSPLSTNMVLFSPR